MSRSAGSILKDQNTKSKSDDKKMLANLDNVKEMGYKSREFLEKGETNKFAELMHDHWLNKEKDQII